MIDIYKTFVSINIYGFTEDSFMKITYKRIHAEVL